MSFPSSFPRSQHLKYRKNGHIGNDHQNHDGGGPDSSHSRQPVEHKKRPAATKPTSYHRHPKRTRLGNHKLVLNRVDDESSVEEVARAVSANNHMKKVGNHKLVARVAASTTAMSLPVPEAADGSKSKDSLHIPRNREKSNSRPAATATESPPNLWSEHRSDTIRRVGTHKLVRATKRTASPKKDVEITDKNQLENCKKLGRNKIVMRHTNEQPQQPRRRQEDAPSRTIRQRHSSGPASLSWKKKSEPSAPICTFFQRKGMCLNPDCKFVHIKVNPRAMRQQQEEQKQHHLRKKRPYYR